MKKDNRFKRQQLWDTDFIYSIFSLLLSAFIFWEVVNIPATEESFLARASFVPLLIGVGILLCGIIILKSALHKKDLNFIAPKGILLLAVFIVLTFAYIYLMDVLGFCIATLTYLIASMFMLSTDHMVKSAVLAVVMVAVLYFIFIDLLKIPFPSGIFL